MANTKKVQAKTNANSNAAKGKGKGNAKAIPVVNSNDTQEDIKDEKIISNNSPELQPAVNETSTDVMDTPKGKDPVEEALEIIQEPRKVKVYWHKRCSNEKDTTVTTIKSDEFLKKTDGTAVIPSPTAEDPNATTTVPVYSLKRNKRIYYLTDVTPQDVLKAERIAKEALETKNATTTEDTATTTASDLENPIV
jgi:hypothetical protein